MPDLKISELADGGNPQDVDQIAAARGTSSTVKLVWSTVRAWLDARFAPISHVSDTANPHVVTAAQTGADPAGSAAGVQGNLDAHVGTGGAAQHPVSTASVAGFAPVLSNVSTEFLNGTGAYSTPAGGAKWVIDAEGSELPAAAQGRTSLNFFGNGVLIADNAGQDRIDVEVQNANVVNVGGGAEVLRDITIGDPSTVNMRTFISGDASVSITQGADTIDLRSTGAGGGESNTQTNIGGGLGIGLPKNGIDLPIRSLNASQFSETADIISVAAGVFDPAGSAATVQGNLDTHEGNTSIHFTVASLPGNGLIQVSTALAVGAGDGITVAADDVGVDATVARRDAANTFLDNITIDVAGAAGFSLLPGFGGVDTRNFAFLAINGVFEIQPTDSGESAVGDSLTMSHGGAMMLGAPTGGLPSTSGFFNAEGIQVNGAAVGDLRTDTSAQVNADTGYTGTSLVLAPSTVPLQTPIPSAGQFRALSGGTASFTVPAMTETGFVSWTLDAAIYSLDLSNYGVVGAPPGSGNASLVFSNFGAGPQVATWMYEA